MQDSDQRAVHVVGPLPAMTARTLSPAEAARLFDGSAAGACFVVTVDADHLRELQAFGAPLHVDCGPIMQGLGRLRERRRRRTARPRRASRAAAVSEAGEDGCARAAGTPAGTSPPAPR
jgi:hypothetical protein